MAHLKENVFRPSTSSMLRSGVMLNYAPEDTMRSMLKEFEQSASLQTNNNNNVDEFTKTMNPQALQALFQQTGHSDSESEEEDDDAVVKHLTEKYGHMLRQHSGSEDEDDFQTVPLQENSRRAISNGDSQIEKLPQPDRRTVKFDLNVAAISNSYNFESSQQTSDSLNGSGQFPHSNDPPNHERNLDFKSTKVSIDSSLEEFHTEECEEDIYVEEDYLPQPQDQVCVGEGKTFEQILEDQLKLEAKTGSFPATSTAGRNSSSNSSSRPITKSTTPSISKPQKVDTNPPKSSNHSSASSSNQNKRRPFLKKNQGLSAWNAKNAISAGVVGRKKKSTPVKSPQDNSRPGVSNSTVANNRISPQTNNGHVRRLKSLGDNLAATLPAAATVKKNEIRATAAPAKWSPVRQTSEGHSSPGKQSTNPHPVQPSQSNRAPQLSASLSHERLNETELDELEEFELLEQVADCSFASSISAVAHLDKGSLKQRLMKTLPSSSRPNQPVNHSHARANSKRSAHQQNVLSDVEDEESTTIQGHLSDSSDDPPVIRQTGQSRSGETEGDNHFMESQPITARPRKVASLMQNRTAQPSVSQFDHRFTALTTQNQSDDGEEEEDDQEEVSWKSATPRPRMFDDEDCWEDMDRVKSQHTRSRQATPRDVPDLDLELTERSDFNSSASPNLPSQQDFFNMAAGVFPVFRADQSKANLNENPAVQSLHLKQWVDNLEREIKRFNSENAALAALKKEKEEAMKRMESEMKAFEEVKEKSHREFEEYKEAELKKLKKERKVFEDYQRALKTMPSKKDREEIDRLKEELAESRNECSSKDSRWQSANNRLRTRIEQLEEEKNELHQRVKLLEQKRLELHNQVNILQTKLTNSNSNKPSRPSLDSVTQSVTFKKAPTVSQTATPRQKFHPAGSARMDCPVSSRDPPPPLHGSGSEESVGLCGTVRASTASDYYTGEEEVYSDRGIHHPTQDQMRPRVSVETSAGYQLTAAQAKSIREYSIKHVKGSMKKEIQHEDGMLERLYDSGSIEIFYPNGSVKEISADGRSTTVNLYNGDVKQTLGDGRTIYYYAEEQIIQTTYPDGLEEIQHKDGRKEIVRSNGVQEIYFPDKSVKYVHPNREEETVYSNGMIVRVSVNGDKEITLTNGQKEIHRNGCKSRLYPDGTSKTVFPDGRQETRYASGRLRIKDKDGNLIVDTKSSGPVLAAMPYPTLIS